MMVYRAMDTVARWGEAGPRAYASDTLIQNKTMLQWMDTTSTYWRQLLSKPGIDVKHTSKNGSTAFTVARRDENGEKIKAMISGKEDGMLKACTVGDLSLIHI